MLNYYGYHKFFFTTLFSTQGKVVYQNCTFVCASWTTGGYAIFIATHLANNYVFVCAINSINKLNKLLCNTFTCVTMVATLMCFLIIYK